MTTVAPDPQFRSDIQGLRALAVVPILLFHLDPSWCPGGYIGVDIFFVISGYLITRMILAEGNDFRFTTFCLRRFYRLFPALIVTLAFTLAAAWQLLPPSDYAALAKSAIASMLGVSNIWFWTTIDYFNAGSHQHPLLHTWSLAVEAQFYIIWPAILLMAARAKIPLIATAGLVAVASYAAVACAESDAMDAAFYLMPFRMFEFAAGAAAVALQRHSSRWPTSISVVAGAIGAAILASGFVVLDRNTPWPGQWTAAVVAGTALLIIAGERGAWRAVLSAAPARHLGRISYSLYLVHWPIITLYRHHTVTAPSIPELVALSLASVAAGALLHHLIEHPMRHLWRPRVSSVSPSTVVVDKRPARHFVLSPVSYRVVLTTVSLTTLVASAAISANAGFPFRIARERVETLDGGLSFGGDLCSTRGSRCAIGDPGGGRIVYLMGDSHALNLVHGLDRLFRANGTKGIVLYDHGCLFLVDTTRFVNGKPDRKCRRNVEETYALLEASRDPVILAGDYAGYASVVGDAASPTPLRQEEGQYHDWLRRKLTESLRRLDPANRKVIVVKQAYNSGIDLPKCLSSPSMGDAPRTCQPFAQADQDRIYGAVDRLVAEVAAQFAGVVTVDPKAVICANGDCVTQRHDELLLRDTTHLTKAGSDVVVDGLQQEFIAALVAHPAASKPK